MAWTFLASPVLAQVEGADSPQTLIEEIEALIRESPVRGTVAVQVERCDTDAVILARNGDLPMIPASTQKLETTAAALCLLGPDFHWRTRIMSNGEIDETGTLQGDLILVGGGDPTIAGRHRGGEVLDTFNVWIDELGAAHGIQRIAGRVVGIDPVFTGPSIVDSWFAEELGEYYEAEVGGLSFNDNCVNIRWEPGPEVGAPALFTIDPDIGFLTVISEVETVASGTSTDRYYHRAHGSSEVVVTGGLPIDAPANDRASVHGPALFTASVFREALIGRGIAVEGEAIDGADLAGPLTPLLIQESPPLHWVIDVTNQVSHNFYADMLLRTLGHEIAGEGSWDGGARVVRGFLEEAGALPAVPEAWAMLDGSGLSPENRTTARMMTALLRHMDTTPHAEMFRASLNRGHADRGHLGHRFRQSPRHEAVGGRILGKPGYIGGVWNLVGFVETQSGLDLRYAVLINDGASSTHDAHTLIDDICVAIASSHFE